MAVKLSGSYLSRSFQLLTTLCPKNFSQDEAFRRASNIIYLWAKGKFSRIFHGFPAEKSSFEDKRDGNEIGILFQQDAGYFIFRCSHPDINIPGRMWITDVELKKVGDKYLFAVRLSVSSLHSCTEEVPFSCPEFVRNIIRNIGISDTFRISEEPILLKTPEEVNGFIKTIGDPARRLPAVLLTPCFDGEAAACGGYMMDAVQMAQDLAGVAHVYQISSDGNDYLTEAVGKQWSAYNGSVRTYYPSLSWEESDCFDHPMLTQNGIRLRDTIESDDSAPCMHEIEKYIQNYVLSQRIDWEYSGIDFYLVAHQNYLRTQRATNEQTRQELIQSYEIQLEQLQKQNEENLSLADSYARDYEAVHIESEKQRQKNGQLKAQIDTLRHQLKQINGAAEIQDIPIDGDYAGIDEWIGQHYPDRLTILPRAIHSLKNALYEDTQLVYKCLMLLANDYFNYRTGQISYDQFIEACKKVDSGLDERGAITDVSAGMQGEEYFVQYRGQRKKLERHLAKGSSKDQRYCLRIYFFWDDQEQSVVIGDLPHHLDTTAT